MTQLHPFPWSAFLIASCVLGCASAKSPVKPRDPIAQRALPPEFVADAGALVEGNNQFALDIYSRLATQPGNLFLSPYSMSTAFGMACAGAAGETQQEMTTVFHYPLPQDRLHTTFGALQKSLDRGTHMGGYELRVANRAWGQRGFPFLAPFLDITRTQYGAEMQQADFGDAESVRQSVNAWVAGQTNQKIENLFPKGSISSATRLVLANAIYFKGRWAAQFDKNRTHDAPFYLSPSQNAQVPTMRMDGTFRVASTDDAHILELPYQGGDLSMLILLPSRIDGLAGLEAGLTLDRLEQWSGALGKQSIEVALPQFKFSSTFPLNGALSEMGMPSAFEAGQADFSGINGHRDLFISAALHQAFVEVNEEGTEAAAATGISVGITSIQPSFTANHPFLFLIRDNITGSILFLGRVTDPRS